LPEEIFADDRLDVAGMKDAFDAWARDAWKEAARVVLIIDGLDQVFKNAGSLTDPLALINWLSALRNEAALGQPPYNKLALFVALTGKTWSAAHASPYASQAAALHLKKFTLEEMSKVFDRLGIDRARYDAADVYDLFHGHPYLTQLFAWDLRSGSSAAEAEQSALDLQSRYDIHWERLKSEIAFLIGTNYDLGEVLGAVVEVVDQPNHLPDEKIGWIWRSYNRDLRIFGLLDGTSSEPEMCRFYRHAVRGEHSQISNRTRKA
jgi:hypothetical protein